MVARDLLDHANRREREANKKSWVAEDVTGLSISLVSVTLNNLDSYSEKLHVMFPRGTRSVQQR